MNVYTPMEGSAEHKNDKLEELCKMLQKHDMLVTAGDMNAKMRKEGYIKNKAGKQTVHE